MPIFQFTSAGSLVVETSEDPALTKTIVATIDTWVLTTDTGRRRMPRDSGTWVRFRDATNGKNTGWLDLRGNVSSYGYQAKDTGGNWNVHVGMFLNEFNTLVDPTAQSTT